MRREVKLGIFITLSVGLVVAVLAGRAISNGSRTPGEQLAITPDDSHQPDTSGLPAATLENTFPDSRLAAEAEDAWLRAIEEPSEPSPTDDAAKRLLASIPGEPPSLPVPSSAEEEMGRYLETTEDPVPSDITSLIGGIEEAEEQSEEEAAALPAFAEQDTDVIDELTEQASGVKLSAPIVSYAYESTPPSKTDSTLDYIDKIALEAEPEVQTSTDTTAIDEKETMDLLTSVEEAISGAAPEGATTHIVRDGERLWNIAAKHYGHGIHWKRIAAANPSVKAHRLRIGTKLIIPPDEPEVKAEVEADDEASGKNIYVIRDGDTLWDISYKFYGSGAKWWKITEANPSIKRPGKLTVGTRLVIP